MANRQNEYKVREYTGANTQVALSSFLNLASRNGWAFITWNKNGNKLYATFMRKTKDII